MDNTISIAFQAIAELLGWTIVHSIWQITIIALVLKLLLNWTSKSDATIRYALGISALLVATFWSTHTFSETLDKVSFANHPSIRKTSVNDSAPEITSAIRHFSQSSYFREIEAQSTKWITPFMPFLAVFWFIGILFFASRILVGLFRLHQFSNHGITLLPSVWSTRLLTLQQLTGIQRPIKVRLSNLVESPMTYQFFRPIILLPVSLFTHLSDEQIEVLLLHELAHIKRNDYVVNLLQSGIEVLFFYHPLIWWMSKQVRLEREYCCDDRVMNLRHNPMLYAKTLTQIQGQHYSFKTKLAMSATGNTGDFSKRIYRLFSQKEPSATLRNSVAALLLLLFSGGMMAFYPKYQASPSIISGLPIIAQDSLPKKVASNTVAKVVTLQSDLITLEKALHENVNALKTEKEEHGLKNEAKLEALQLKAGALKKELHVKTQELKQLTNNTSKGFRLNANQGESLDLKMKDGLLTLKTLKGKKPIIYLNNEIYHKWKIDSEGTLLVDIPSEEVHSINVFKEDKAMAMFGPDASDGVVYINTKANPNPEVILKEKEEKLHVATSAKKSLVIVNGKVSKLAVEDIDPDDIATINVIGGETAIKLYGDKGKDDVIEIYTKDYEPKAASKNKTITGKIEGNSFTLKSDNPDKKPLMVIDGKVSQQEMKDLDTDKIGVMSVLKGKAALEKYGADGKDGVVEIYTKGNEPTEKSAKAKKAIKLNGAVGTPKSNDKKNEETSTIGKLNNNKKPLFVVDGKKLPSHTTNLETMDILPDDIATISVLKEEKAIEKYGEEGVNGVVEIITKANKKGLKEQEKVMKAKEKERKAIKKDRKQLKKEKVKQQQKAMNERQQTVEAKQKTLKAQKLAQAEKAIQSPAHGLSVFPNPTRQLTNIQLNLKKKGSVKVDILNITGQVVLNLVNEDLESGVHQFQWNSDNQPAGSYFVHFNLDGELISKQVVVKK